jgi:thiol-disulfide isomerase/thioredoxin
MKSTQILVIALVGLVLGAVAGFGFKFFTTHESAQDSEASADFKLLSAIPEFSFPDLQGQTRNGREWRDRILVLNFWAAWCPPCREETPMLLELQKKYANDNVRFVGIAIDDKQPVQDFVDTLGVEYPVLLGDLQAIGLSKRLGNSFEGLPFTVVAEPGGKVILRHQGGISREQLEPVLQQAIKDSHRTYAAAERI